MHNGESFDYDSLWQWISIVLADWVTLPERPILERDLVKPPGEQRPDKNEQRVHLPYSSLPAGPT